MPLTLSQLTLSTTPRKPEDGIVLRDLSLSVGAGECLGIVGEEGAGKSMLIKAVAGLLPPAARIVQGELSFPLADETASRTEENWWRENRRAWRRLRRTRLALFEGEPLLAWNPRLSVRVHLEESLRFSGRGKDRKRPESWMPCFYEVGLIEPETLLERFPKELPSLVLRRLQLGIALARGSDTWLLDEPGLGLEAGSRLAWFELVRTVSRERGASVLAVSRSARGLARVADRIEWLQEGILVDIGGEGPRIGEGKDMAARGWAEALASLAIPEIERPGIEGERK